MSDPYRNAVISRDGQECQDCGAELAMEEDRDRPVAHAHHIVPESEGGRDVVSNRVALCPSCHSDRHPDNGVGVEMNPDGDREIDGYLLDCLRDGRVNARYASERLKGNSDDYSRGYVRQRLNRLAQHGHVQALDGGLYALADDPREDTPTGVDLDAVRRCVENLETALERGDRPEIRERMNELTEELDDD